MSIRRLVLVELAALALLLAALSAGPAVRASLICVAAGCAIGAFARWRRRSLSARISVVATWALRRPGPGSAALVTDGIVIDAGGAVGVFELGDPTMLVTTAETPLPRLDRWPSLSQSGGPRVQQQVLVEAARGFLAVRACRGTGGASFADPALLAALNTALRRASRRLHHDGVAHRRLDGADLEAVTGAGVAPREAWAHLTIGPTRQITLRTSRPADPLDQDQLVRVSRSPDVETVVAWAGSGRSVTIRLISASDEALAAAVAHVTSVLPVRRLDGDHLQGRRLTLPLALDPDDAPTSPDGSSGQLLSIPASGVVIGDDRTGRRLRIRPPASGAQVRVIVIGGPAAARTLERQASGVPLRVDVLDRVEPSDAAALRAADVVLCQPLSPVDADAVAGALDLSSATADWLTRIDRGMVAVIADGMVRWAMMPAPVATDPDAQGLAAFART